MDNLLREAVRRLRVLGMNPKGRSGTSSYFAFPDKRVVEHAVVS